MLLTEWANGFHAERFHRQWNDEKERNIKKYFQYNLKIVELSPWLSRAALCCLNTVSAVWHVINGAPTSLTHAQRWGGWQISNWTAGSWSLDEKKTQQSFTVEDLTRSVRKWPARWKESLWREVRSWWPSSSVSLHISRVQKLALSSLNTHACGANVLTWPGLLPFKSENTVSGRKWLRSTLHLSAQPTKLCRFC